MSSRRMLATVLGALALGVTSMSAPAHSAAATCAGLPATIVGTTGDDELTGPGRDRVVGGRGDDRCRGEDLVGCETVR